MLQGGISGREARRSTANAISRLDQEEKELAASERLQGRIRAREVRCEVNKLHREAWEEDASGSAELIQAMARGREARAYVDTIPPPCPIRPKPRPYRAGSRREEEDYVRPMWRAQQEEAPSRLSSILSRTQLTAL